MAPHEATITRMRSHQYTRFGVKVLQSLDVCCRFLSGHLLNLLPFRLRWSGSIGFHARLFRAVFFNDRFFRDNFVATVGMNHSSCGRRHGHNIVISLATWNLFLLGLVRTFRRARWYPNFCLGASRRRRRDIRLLFDLFHRCSRGFRDAVRHGCIRVDGVEVFPENFTKDCMRVSGFHFGGIVRKLEG
jgi:hypothetical protein